MVVEVAAMDPNQGALWLRCSPAALLSMHLFTLKRWAERRKNRGKFRRKPLLTNPIV